MTHRWFYSLILTALCVAFVGVAGVQAADYVGSKKCKACHSKQYKSWAKGKKAHAVETLGADKAKAECLSCHTTNGSADLEAGVGCESCHGPGSDYKKVMKDKKYKKADALAAGMTDVTQATCDKCHDPSKSDTAKKVVLSEAKDKVHEHKALKHPH